jgi:hypothetical protein
LKSKVAALATSGLLASAGLTMGAPSADTAVLVVARTYTGEAVVRCAEVHYDTTNHRWRVHGTVTDAPGDVTATISGNVVVGSAGAGIHHVNSRNWRRMSRMARTVPLTVPVTLDLPLRAR